MLQPSSKTNVLLYCNAITYPSLRWQYLSQPPTNICLIQILAQLGSGKYLASLKRNYQTGQQDCCFRDLLHYCFSSRLFIASLIKASKRVKIVVNCNNQLLFSDHKPFGGIQPSKAEEISKVLAKKVSLKSLALFM